MKEVKVYGVNRDGEHILIGTTDVIPSMKRRDIVATFFERPNDDPDDCSEANMCLWALESYHEWLVQQGWTGPAMKIDPKQP